MVTTKAPLKKGDCICKMGPGHTYPNQLEYVIDHRCPKHGEKAQPAVWGRHKELELVVTVDQYNALADTDEEVVARHVASLQRCGVSVHPGTARSGFRCELAAGHEGDHDFGDAYRKHKKEPKP
jgi:hypothetical protein